MSDWSGSIIRVAQTLLLLCSFLFLLELPTDLEPHRCSAGVLACGFTPASRRGSSVRQRDAVGTRSRDDCATNRFMETKDPGCERTPSVDLPLPALRWRGEGMAAFKDGQSFPKCNMLVCGFAGHSCPVYRATGKSPESRIAGLESLRYIIMVNSLIRQMRKPCELPAVS
jgi:hypothetical protein